MEAKKWIVIVVCLCSQWQGASATFLNILQLGNASNPNTTRVQVNVRPFGIPAIIGSGILGIIANAARNPFRIRFGRSIDDSTGAIELVLQAVESLDSSGCAKRLLCEEAAYSVHGHNGLENLSYKLPIDVIPLDHDTGDEEEETWEDDVYMDELGEAILKYIKNDAGNEIPEGSSREKWLAVIEFGETGGDCSSSSCPLNRVQILRDLFQNRFL